MDALKLMSEGSLKEKTPEFSIGDTVRVDVKIREGERERIQAYDCLLYTSMRVAALLGRGGKEALTWFADGTGYPEITSYIEGVAAYNAYVPAEQRFYGVHLDLEPDMTDDYLKYRSQMRRFLLYTRELCDRHGLQLELDVNAWFDDSQVAIDENGREVIMGDVVTTACDAITVMAYRANAADQLDIAD